MSPQKVYERLDALIEQHEETNKLLRALVAMYAEAREVKVEVLKEMLEKAERIARSTC